MADRKSQRLSKHWKKREEKKKKKQEEDLRPQMVTISSDVEELSIGADSGGSYSEGSQSSTKTQERYRKYLKGSKEEQKMEELAKANGWCNPDGTPWGYKNMPKDEAALLKQGVVDRSCKRSTYFSFESPQAEDAPPLLGYPKFYDEVELLNRGLVDKKGHCHHRRGHQGLVSGGVQRDAIASGPITIAELNSRGIFDSNGNVHYGMKSLLKATLHEASERSKKKKKAKTSNSSKKQQKEGKKKKENMKHQEELPAAKSPPSEIGDCRKAKNRRRRSSRCLSNSPKELSPTETRISFSSIQSPHNSSSSSSSSSAKATQKSVMQKPQMFKPAISPGSSAEGTFGTIKCQVGSDRNGGKDGGTVAYTVTKDGRNYELNTNDGHFCHLEFNKRHAYLILG